MGTPEFAVAPLQALFDAAPDVVAIYAQPPRPAGRGYGERKSPVQLVGERRGIPVHTPRTLRSDEVQQQFASHGADVAVVAAYGLILPPAILAAPRLGCLNIHASLLPRWRGAAPIQRAIMAGDSETGICIMKMDEGLDTGPVYARARVPIGSTTTAGELHDQLAGVGATEIVRALDALATGTVSPSPQPSDGVTYAAKITKEETRIDWSQPARTVDCHIRGLSPRPGAWFRWQGQRLKVLASIQIDGRGPAGTVIDHQLTVACGATAVRLLKVQQEGGRPLSADDYLRGRPVAPGSVFD